jgi:hypothetical protein
MLLLLFQLPGACNSTTRFRFGSHVMAIYVP